METGSTTLRQAPRPPQGTASISRAVDVLREIGIYDRQGIRLVDLSRNLRLERSTAHRVLQCLLYENLVAFKQPGNRYVLGPLAFELGLGAARRFKLVEVWRPVLRSIADETRDVVFLSVRSHVESVCVDRAEGPQATTAYTVRVGDRRPLGFGCVGSAILSLSPAAEIRRILALKSGSLKAYSATESSEAYARALETQRNGHALHARPSLNVRALAVPIVDPGSGTHGAISICAASSRMDDARIAALIEIIRAAVQPVMSRRGMAPGRVNLPTRGSSAHRSGTRGNTGR
ncbi:MAG: IclR family transcriptional regulator [Lautropia sp.]